MILHFWGPGMFQSLRPFFLGLILGEVAVAGFWGVIYHFTTEKGHWLTVM